MQLQTFTADNQVEKLTTKEFDGAVWKNFGRKMYTYTPTGNVESIVDQSYNSGAWENDYRLLYTYNSNDEVEVYLHQVWNSGWENSSRTVYAYSGGELSHQTDQHWNGSSWDDANRRMYTYANGDEVEILYQDWNGTSWENHRRKTSQYDTDGWLAVVTWQDWNGTTSSWDNNYRKLYDHNSGEPYYASITTQDFVSGNWENGDRTVYNFNSFGKIGEMIWSYWDGTLWEQIQRFEVFYEQYNDGAFTMEPEHHLGVKVYPNPAADYVLFKSSENDEMIVEIFDLNGRLVDSKKGDGAIKFYNHGQLSSGIYQYSITIQDKQQSGQLIIQ
jgi:hypothetical protein